jgi:hypothetical protein
VYPKYKADGPIRGDVDSEPAVQLIKDLFFLKSFAQGAFSGSALFIAAAQLISESQCLNFRY